jgi:hypothetical protein
MPGVPRWPLTIRVVIADWKAAPPGVAGRHRERREGLAEAVPSRRSLSLRRRHGAPRGWIARPRSALTARAAASIISLPRTVSEWRNW